MRAGRTSSLALAIVALAACGAPPPSPPDAAPAVVARTSIEGPVAATIDGEPIALSDVEAVARATGLSPREALRRIEDEVLLHRAATAAGVTADAEVEREVRRALVWAFLAAEIEASITPSTLAPDDVAARLERDRRLFTRPERRRSTHVLVRMRRGRELDPAAEAEMAALAGRIALDLRGAGDAAAAAHERWASGATDADATYEAIVEDVPAAWEGGALDPGYTAVLFALSAVGDVSEPVATSFGTHVIVLTEVLPAFATPEAEAETIVRRQMVGEARAEALIALEDRLLREHPPVIDAAVADRLVVTDLSALR